MKKNNAEESKGPSNHYRGLEELKLSCPEGTSLSGPADQNGLIVTVNGQCEAACISSEGVRNGSFIRWYENGNKAVQGSYSNDRKSGEWTYWSPTGHITGKGNFYNDRPDGKWQTWYENGQKESEGEYEQGVQHGKFIYWDEKNNISKILHYENGKVVKDEI